MNNNQVTNKRKKKKNMVRPLHLWLGIAASIVAILTYFNLQPEAKKVIMDNPDEGYTKIEYSPTVFPTPTVTPTPFPIQLKAYYLGVVRNTTLNVNQASRVAIKFNQQGDKIAGEMLIEPPLIGSGTFENGSIDSEGNISFDVLSTDGFGLTLQFSGTVFNDAQEITGKYTVGSQQQGIWQVSTLQ